MPSPPTPPEIPVVLPELGLDAIRVSAWFAEPGDAVYEGDRIVEVSGGGATFDVAAPATGRLTSQLVLPRDQLQSGQVLGFVAAQETD
jgi:pyruvate/2-oxoglutarate dehydrogenase complex dihydrolipoamide acyltransferase (E2) component